MISISYNLSPAIGEVLGSIDAHQARVLTTVLPPATMRRISWDSMIGRLVPISTVCGARLNAESIAALVAGSTKPTNDQQRTILNFRSTLYSLYEEWTGTNKPLTWNTIETITKQLTVSVRSRFPWTYVNEKLLRETLHWISITDQHVVVTAALLYGSISAESSGDTISPIGSLLSYISLAKRGYDGRGLVTLEDAFWRMPLEIHDGNTSARKSGNFTPWIEHFTHMIDRQYSNVIEKLDHMHQVEMPAFFSLTDRQRRILGIGDAPGVQITNRKVAKAFGISQITSSRDLAHLTALGLLMAHGRGRSVYYTRM